MGLTASLCAAADHQLQRRHLRFRGVVVAAFAAPAGYINKPKKHRKEAFYFIPPAVSHKGYHPNYFLLGFVTIYDWRPQFQLWSYCKRSLSLKLVQLCKKLPKLPRPPNLPLLRALWSLLVGIWGVLKGSWGVLVGNFLSKT